MAELEARGIPTVGVATTEFIEGAKAQAKSLGTDPALVFVPHPVQDRTDDESAPARRRAFRRDRQVVGEVRQEKLSRIAGEGADSRTKFRGEAGEGVCG